MTHDVQNSPATSTLSPLDADDRTRLSVVAVAAALTCLAAFVAPPDGLALGSADAGSVRAWWTSHAVTLHAAALSAVVAAVGLIVVAAGVSALVRRHSPRSMLPELMVAGGVGTAVILLIDLSAQAVGLLLPDLVGTRLDQVDDGIVAGWVAAAGVTHLLGDLQVCFLAVTITAGSLAALRIGLVLRWLCYAGLAVGVSAALGSFSIVLGAAALYPFWFVAVFGLYASMGVLAVSALLARRRIRLAATGGTAEAAEPAVSSREA